MRLLLVLGVLGILGMLGVFPVLRARWLRHLHDDRLDGTRGRGALHVLPLLGVGCRIIPERFLAMQPEDARGQETTLGVGLAAIEVNHQMDWTRSCGGRRHLCMCG